VDHLGMTGATSLRSRWNLVHLWELYKGEITYPESRESSHETEFRQLSLMAFAVLNVSVSKHVQQAIRKYRDRPEPAERHGSIC